MKLSIVNESTKLDLQLIRRIALQLYMYGSFSREIPSNCSLSRYLDFAVSFSDSDRLFSNTALLIVPSRIAAGKRVELSAAFANHALSACAINYVAM